MREWITNTWDLIQWGTATEFFAGVGTVGALIVAYRLLRREAGRDEVRAVEARSDQARLVAAWVRVTGDDRASWARAEPPPRDHEIVMLNSSPSPVYDVEVHHKAMDAKRGSHSLGNVRSPILPPGESTIALHPDVVEGWIRRFATHPKLEVDIEFTDGAGLRWRRSNDGVLTEVSARK